MPDPTTEPDDPGTLRAELEDINVRIKALKDRRRDIYRASLAAPPDQKVCIDCEAEFMAGHESPQAPEPVTVRKFVWNDTQARVARGAPQLVRVRPCTGNGAGKTHLGILVGDLPCGVSVSVNRETGIAHVSPGYPNPAIVIPSLGRMVYGAESWWGRIDSPEDLADITDDTIDRAWATVAGALGLGAGEKTDA